MKHVIYFIALSLLFLSCRTPKNFGSEKTRTVKDSVSTEIKYIPKDTTVFIPADSVTLRSLISELSENAITKTSGRSTLSLQRIGNEIIGKCNTEAFEIEIAYQNKIIEIYRQQEIRDQETIRIPVRYIPKLIKTLAWIGGIVLVLIIVKIILKVKKPV